MDRRSQISKKNNIKEELYSSLRFNGFSEEQIAIMAENHTFLKRVLKALKDIKPKSRLRLVEELILDLSKDPMAQGDLVIESHEGHGVVHFDATKLRVYSKEDAELGLEKDVTIGDILVVRGTGGFVNANCLDFMLEKQDLIPEDFKPWEMLFVATKYRGGCVRSLYYDRPFDRFDWAVVSLSKPLASHQCLLSAEFLRIMGA